MNSMGGTSRTGTHMSAVDFKYLSFTGVGYTDLDYVNLGATRSGAKGAGPDIEAGQTDRNGQRRADARIHLPPIPGPARMPLMGEGETMQGLMSALEQRRLDASLTRGQGLPGSVWQTLAQDFVILPHLLDNPEHPRDDLLPLYAKLFLAALGIPIRSASATNKIQGVLMLYLPYTTADGDLVEQAAEPFRQLLVYHALEEVEHKAVCFDLYQQADGSYWKRTATMAFVTVDLLLRLHNRMRYLLQQDGLWNAENRRATRQLLWGKQGVSASRKLDASGRVKVPVG